jgi:chromosome partitioning protein
VLGTELAGFGAAVAMIDADPNKPLSHWAKRAGRPENLTVISDVAEDSIIDAIESAAVKAPAKAIKLVRVQERVFRRKIPYCILFTRTNPAIRTRTFQSIEDEFALNQTPMFKTHLNEREAYRALFAFGGTLAALDTTQVPNITAAIMNARIYTNEVVNMLKAKAPVSKSEEVA